MNPSELDEDAAAMLRRLRWQCRRGMKELDVVLTRYLDRRFSVASAQERQNFERLLKVEDDRLWDWVLGRAPAEDPEFHALIERLRSPD